MARILAKRKAGEPRVRKLKNSWGRPGRNGLRGRLSITTFRKVQPQDAVMKGVPTMTISSDGLQKVTNGTVVPGTQARGTVHRKVQRLTPKPAKGTKVIAPPSPTNRGGVKNLYRRGKV